MENRYAQILKELEARLAAKRTAVFVHERAISYVKDHPSEFSQEDGLSIKQVANLIIEVQIYNLP